MVDNGLSSCASVSFLDSDDQAAGDEITPTPSPAGLVCNVGGHYNRCEYALTQNIFRFAFIIEILKMFSINNVAKNPVEPILTYLNILEEAK